MNDTARAALVACLLEGLEGEGGEASTESPRAWPASGHPHYRSWAWHPQGPAAWRLAGRIRQHRSRSTGRY